MPWTKEYVDEHRKELSDYQKSQWLRIANAVLQKCVDNGGNESSCYSYAMKQADGGVNYSKFAGSFYAQYKRKQEGQYQVEHQTYQGREYLVVPVTMMVEGVHNGSHGPMLHTIEDLGLFPASWNGIPIVIDHPELNGVPISANDPKVLDNCLVGIVFNTHVDGLKLVAQAWLEEERLRQLSSVVLAQIEAGEPVEVSLGMFTEDIITQGEWNGEQYEAIAKNHRPDHLALLPGGLGACSIEDGCGIRVNKEGGKNEVNEKEFNNALKAYYVSKIMLVRNEKGYRELVDAVRSKLDSMDSESSMYFLHEVYDETVIYEVRMRMGGNRIFKQGYTFENGVVELQGSPTEVRRKVEYVAMAESSGMVRTKFNNNKNHKKMAGESEKCTPCVQEKVTALIGDGKGKFKETDREWLETLSEEQLDKLTPTVITKEVEVLSAEDKAVLEEAKQAKKEKREANIKRIQNNSKDWTKEELEVMSDSVLTKIAGMVGKEVVDYSAFGGTGFQTDSSKIEPLPPTGIEFKEMK